MEPLFKPKLFSILKNGYSGKQFSGDLLSGIVVGVVALPLAIAFAVASGVSPERGIITAVVAGFLISLLGGSRVQIGGPTGAFIIIVFGIISEHGLNGLLISTILAGFFLIGFGLMRLGNLLKYFPRPLIVGFTSGIALVIFSTQIRDALGLEIAKVPSEFIEKWSTYWETLGTTNIYALFITIGTILIISVSRKYISRIPGSFIAIITVTLLVKIAGIPVTTIGSFFGTISSKISFHLPDIDFSSIGNYLQPALTIALLGGIESLLSAVVADGMIGGNHRSNTELIAQGVANIVTPFFGGIPATGAIARTATNIRNGGRTPVAGIVHAITLLLILLFFGKWASLIPMSCLAGILIVVAYNMSEWRSFLSVMKGAAGDKIILLTTFFLTVFVDLTVAIEVGVVLAAMLFMKRMADIAKTDAKSPMDSDVLDDYSGLPAGVSVYEISGPLFFASAKEYSEVIKSVGRKERVLIIRMRHVPFVDATGLHNFKEAIKTIMNTGTTVILSGVNDHVLADLEQYGIMKMVGKPNIFSSFESALTQASIIAEK